MRLFRSRRTRGASAGALNASASVPDSGVASVNNATGASATSAEVISYLGSCIDDLNSEGDFASQRRHVERQMIDRVSRFPNSGLPDGVGQEWCPNLELLDMVSVALKCSIEVYQNSSPDLGAAMAGFEFNTIRSISASMSGVTKATNLIEVSGTSPHSHFPALVVSVRGTRPKEIVDWLVNLNHELRDIGYLKPTGGVSAASLPWSQAKVHAGFLNGANALLPAIKKQIKCCVDTTSTRHVILTGHSAGGAVASLIFVHLLSVAQSEYQDIKLSLIAFGSPPVCSGSVKTIVNHFMGKQKLPGTALAIVNEHDPIALADPAYIHSLIQLYDLMGSESELINDEERSPWTLPTPTTHAIGDLVVLKGLNVAKKELDVHAYGLQEEEFAKLIFCQRSMHQKAQYEKYMARLRERAQARSDELEGILGNTR